MADDAILASKRTRSATVSGSQLLPPDSLQHISDIPSFTTIHHIPRAGMNQIQILPIGLVM